MDTFLGEVADVTVFGFGDFSAGGFDDICYAFHEGRFTGTIVSSEGDALLRHDGEGEVLEENAWAEFDFDVFDGKHGGVVA